MRKGIAHTVLFFFLVHSLHVFAQPRRGGNGTAIHLGPSLGFYRFHSRHAVNPSMRTSISGGIHREIRADRSYRTFVQFGLDYFVHGLSYDSYYFTSDSLQLYDKSFGFEYDLLVHEFNVPLQIKMLFNRGDNKLFSPYATAAYHLRYLIQGRVDVTQFGNKVRRDYPDVLFRNHLITDKINAFVSAGLGWQRNKINDRGTAFFAEINFRYGFSDFYFKAPYSASSVFINATHLVLVFGLKL